MKRKYASSFQIVYRIYSSESRCGLFGCQVSLHFTHHLESNEELPDCRAAQ